MHFSHDKLIRIIPKFKLKMTKIAIFTDIQRSTSIDRYGSLIPFEEYGFHANAASPFVSRRDAYTESLRAKKRQHENSYILYESQLPIWVTLAQISRVFKIP